MSLEAKVDECVFDINKLTREGWEIKTSRRVWKDFNANSEPDSYEWAQNIPCKKEGIVLNTLLEHYKGDY